MLRPNYMNHMNGIENIRQQQKSAMRRKKTELSMESKRDILFCFRWVTAALRHDNCCKLQQLQYYRAKQQQRKYRFTFNHIQPTCPQFHSSAAWKDGKRQPELSLNFSTRFRLSTNGSLLRVLSCRAFVHRLECRTLRQSCEKRKTVETLMPSHIFTNTHPHTHTHIHRTQCTTSKCECG